MTTAITGGVNFSIFAHFLFFYKGEGGEGPGVLNFSKYVSLALSNDFFGES